MNKKNITIITLGSTIAIIITSISLIILACLLAYTNLKENVINPAIITIMGISLIIGSAITSKKMKKNGIINGIITSFIYIAIIYLISCIIAKSLAFNIYSFIVIIVTTILSIIGGIIGVNL